MQNESASVLSQARERNITADAWRGLAAVAVIGSHFQALIEDGNFPSADLFSARWGETLRYLFSGSSLYFFVISGFVLGGKIPEWNRRPGGLFFRCLKRQTHILLIFWAAFVLVGTLNLIKWWTTGKPWYNPTFAQVFVQFFLFSNAINMQGHRIIPPSWYLEADLAIVFGVVTAYWLWTRLPITMQEKSTEPLWLLTIPLTAFSLQVQIFYPMGHGAEAPFRGLAYFLLGLQAWHASTNRCAFVCLIINSLLIHWWTDTSSLHTYFGTSGTVLLAWLLCTSRIRPATHQLFEGRAFRFLSQHSFSLFLLNFFVLQVGVSLARHVSPQSLAGLVGVVILTLCALFLTAVCFHKWVEVPLLSWHDGIWKRFFAWVSQTEPMAAAKNAKTSPSSDQSVQDETLVVRPRR
jgi:peptidoglycan/LPS O-acetylase OafA/YrhL